jgi:hypothetical protein
MLRPAKLPPKTVLQPSPQTWIKLNKLSGLQTDFSELNPEAQAALPESQKTAAATVTQKSCLETQGLLEIIAIQSPAYVLTASGICLFAW